MNTGIVLAWLLLYALYLLLVIFLAGAFLKGYLFPRRKIVWPSLSFGPVNLWTVTPALEFYASPREQWDLVWKEYPLQEVSICYEGRGDSLLFRRMEDLVAQR